MHFAGGDRRPSPVVDVDPILFRSRQFTPVECGVDLHDDRPRVGVAGRFARKVTTIQLGEGSVEVTGLECDEPEHPLVGVDLDDVQNVDME